ncbi:hypothetical protein TNCT_518841 [Trichonephila clavata]|uniref:Uncharacterized protein n=1 Tax=Trichonephila clavata TaxID=2740835 RepID=A0A8X6JSP9_TRICU|nr:hypothetical protein TNCT_518841 [Trichonephila clavata]
MESNPNSNRFSFTICNISMDICETLINWFISTTISTLWILCRGMKYTWLLENVLSIAFYGTLVYCIPFSSFKVCLCVLCMDLFLKMLLILSGYLDSNGMEFMYGEPVIFQDSFIIPIYTQVKDIGFDPLRACRRVFMVVDLMDLAVFGLTLSYCYVLDLLTNKNRLYYIIMVIPYCLGRFLKDFIVLQFETPLCASFIMPAVFVPPVILAWYRNEFPLLWNGFKVVKKIVEQKRNVIELTAKETNEQSEENTEVVDFL